MSDKKLTGSQVLLKSLKSLGIELLLGYTGGAIMPTFDALREFPNFKFITCRHEQGAGFIAQGYTRASGKIAPIMVTSGPGATNLVTAVADAMMDSVPMFAITGQVSTNVIGTDAFQESDIIGMMYACTKYAYMPLSTDELSKSIAELHFIATTGRPGPVVLDLPKDIQTNTTEITELPEKLDLPGLQIPQDPNLEDVQKAVDIIDKAKKPIALIGHGIILSEAFDELQEFLEKAQIPAAFTVHGLSSLPASHNLNLGMMGMHGEIEANKAIRDADTIIALGMRFDDRVTGKLSTFKKDRKVIHVEIDPSEINKNIAVDVAINSDLKKAIKELTNLVQVKTSKDRKDFFEEIDTHRAAGKKYYEHIFNKGVGKTGKLLMARIIHDLSEFTEGQDNVVSDVGQHQMFSAKFYKYQRPNTWFNSGGLGTMGFGLPASIGVKLARPNEEVWCINGDGGVQMNIQELGTIMQENLNINILILNNNYLGMVRQWQDLFYGKNYAETELVNPNFQKLAEAYNVSYKKVEKVEDIKTALEWSKNETKATIVEFICEKDEMVYPMIAPGMSYEEMIENEADAKAKLRLDRD
jgi:acetolactate synthase-1/2/3 large subunit